MLRATTVLLFLFLYLIARPHASDGFSESYSTFSTSVKPLHSKASTQKRNIAELPAISKKRSIQLQLRSRKRIDGLLLSTYSGGDTPSKDGDENDKKWRGNPLVIVRKFIAQLLTLRVTFVARFGQLSRRAKLLLASQLLALGLFLGVGFRSIVSSPGSNLNKPIEVPYSTFMKLCKTNKEKVKVPTKTDDEPSLHLGKVVVGQDKIGFKLLKVETQEQADALELLKAGKPSDDVVKIPQRSAYTRKVSASPEFINFLDSNDISFQASPNTKGEVASYFTGFIGMFYIFFLIRLYKTMSGGGGNSAGVGKLAQKKGDLPLAKFEDIEGVDNAKFEVMELVDTLRNPSKYAILGARAPTGLLLEGPPGTGKTMLARATAATAGVPLLYCSGSDFVEMFVGRGAARVRSTFERARKLAPCIIFIDELDALGKSRAEGALGGLRGNDEAEQTLNQLLACMDGLDSRKGICVLAATNRREVLDKALLRPGRFDRIVKIELPSTAGRERILRVHASKLPGFKEGTGVDERRPGSLGKEDRVDLSAVAAVTPGLSGAELEFIVNEAAIRAVRRVSSELQNGMDPAKIIPNVDAEDFEASVKSFYSSRKPGVGQGMSDIMSNLLGK